VTQGSLGDGGVLRRRSEPELGQPRYRRVGVLAPCRLRGLSIHRATSRVASVRTICADQSSEVTSAFAQNCSTLAAMLTHVQPIECCDECAVGVEATRQLRAAKPSCSNGNISANELLSERIVSMRHTWISSGARHETKMNLQWSDADFETHRREDGMEGRRRAWKGGEGRGSFSPAG